MCSIKEYVLKSGALELNWVGIEGEGVDLSEMGERLSDSCSERDAWKARLV